MIFHWIVLDLYAYELNKNAEKPEVISFLSQITCQKAVHNTSFAGYSCFFKTGKQKDYYSEIKSNCY